MDDCLMVDSRVCVVEVVDSVYESHWPRYEHVEMDRVVCCVGLTQYFGTYLPLREVNNSKNAIHQIDK